MDIADAAVLFFSLLVGHAIADYPLQGDFLAKAKNHTAPIPGVDWWIALGAHALIHGGMVAYLTGSPLLGVGEMIVHVGTDYREVRGGDHVPARPDAARLVETRVGCPPRDMECGMSWSKSTSGAPSSVINAAEQWAEEVAAVDSTWAPQVVRDRHAAQVGRCVDAIKEFAGRVPPGYQMTVSVNGHADEKQADTWNVNMGAYLPVPVAAAGG